jgi:hypothetical protein
MALTNVSTGELVQELRQRFADLESARALLQNLGSSSVKVRGRKAAPLLVGRKRRKMSAAARKKISQAQKLRWSRVKGK